MPAPCRLCAQEKAPHELFDMRWYPIVITHLALYAKIQIIEEDVLTKEACYQCCDRLREMVRTLLEFQNAQKIPHIMRRFELEVAAARRQGHGHGRGPGPSSSA